MDSFLNVSFSWVNQVEANPMLEKLTGLLEESGKCGQQGHSGTAQIELMTDKVCGWLFVEQDEYDLQICTMKPLRPFNPNFSKLKIVWIKPFDVKLCFSPGIFQTVKVQGNDISHKLQISKVRKKDEGLYECRVTDANYGELQEHKAQAYLKVNANSHARRMQAFEASPMWLQDMKPRKNASSVVPSSIHSSANQQTHSTSSPQAVAKIPKQSPQSGMETHFEPFILSLTNLPPKGQLNSIDRLKLDGFSNRRPSSIEMRRHEPLRAGGWMFRMSLLH